MKPPARFARVAGAAAWLTMAAAGQAQQQQTWTGVLSDSTCGASHQAAAAPRRMTDRECAFHCLSALAEYVLVDENGKIVPIANQDFAGLPLRLARPVRLTGALTERGIVIARIEPPLVHAHLGHVMTAWRDTPGGVGLLTIALSDTRVAAAHALLAAKAAELDDIQLHAAHVLHALEPALEQKGPASGYGVRQGAAGALQHVGFAAGVEQASPVVKAKASDASASLNAAILDIERAIAAAQAIGAARAGTDAAARSAELLTLVDRIGAFLEQAQQHMSVIMKAEGL